MSRRNRYTERRKKPEAETQEVSMVDESSVIIRQFLGYQQELDGIHDKHERLVKLSRDVTIESKRTIFLLQRISGDKEKESIIPEAHKKLEEIQKQRWRPIAEELKGEDPYKYLRAFSPGLQEYIEALSFCHFLEFKTLISLEEVQSTLRFTEQEPDKTQVNQSTGSSVQDTISNDEAMDLSAKSTRQSCEDNQNLECPKPPSTLCVHVPPIEYMLGLADLTGEVMRMAIHSVSSADTELRFLYCEFLRTIYNSFLQFGNVHRELGRKLYTLKQSLQKVEAACYTFQVRGSEFPQHMLQDILKNVGSETRETDPV